ncbi:MAG: Mrp/NBP35 family ATP-binding protein [Crenarchaeota archaeon]|jgi:ATP-binding protein involved in chromosome partitioning|nr:Mrp/NBP35 family ATP-binding protein [Thermoproteota archaeon]
MIDPRTSVITQRLARIKHIVAVTSGKGGVGKSIVSTALALSLLKEGYHVGLFDIDFTGPSTHIILGVEKNIQPKEDKGIVPATVEGLAYMSLVYFVAGKATPLRGVDVSNALIELLAVTQWGELDFLIIDMPPGIGDAVLDLVRLIERIKFLIVTTPSLLAFDVVKKQVEILTDLKMPIVGIVENMKRDNADTIKSESSRLGLMYLGGVQYDSRVENFIGNPLKLLQIMDAYLDKIKKAFMVEKGNNR